MSRYSPRMTKADLEAFIRAKVSNPKDLDILAAIDEDANSSMDQIFNGLIMESSPTMRKMMNDWAKIQFDYENIYIIQDRIAVSPNELYGLQELPNGFAFIGIDVGGDWEDPVFVIGYSDGKQLRGYVPTDGNVFDKASKTAYGNGVDKPDTEEFDWQKIEADIVGRIQVK